MKSNNLYIVAVELDADDIASTIQKAKDRMMDYAYDVFEDGIAVFTHRGSAFAYASGLNKEGMSRSEMEVDVQPTYQLFKVSMKLEDNNGDE